MKSVSFTNYVRILAIVLLAMPAASQADDMIEVSGGGDEITVREFLQAPAFQDAESRKELLESTRAALELTEFESEELKENVMGAMTALEIAAEYGEGALQVAEAYTGTLDHLPFKRILDLQIGTGIMDLIHGCIEFHPVGGLVFEGCSSVTIFIVSLSGNIKYRWDMLLYQNASGGIHQITFGPGIGIRAIQACLFDCSTGWMASAMASLEYVYWFTRHFGLTVQLDAGAEVLMGWNDQDVSNQTSPVLPMAKLSIGFAF